MRILFFNRSFHPDVEATGQLLSELCEDLSREHEVTVIAGRPYNVARWRGFGPVRAEWFGRVRVFRVYNPRLDKRRFFARLLNLASYFGFSFLAGFFARRPAVVVAETDPPVLGLIGLFFARLYRAKFVFYLQDLFPDVGVALRKLRNPILIKLLDASTRRILRAADEIVVLSEDMRRRVTAKGCCSPERIRIIPNWADTDRIRPRPRQNRFRLEHCLDNSFVVMFSGNIGLSQGLDQVIETAAAMRNVSAIKFVFVGEGAAKKCLMARATSLGLENVRFLPYQPKELLSRSLSAADIHLVTLERGLTGLIVPSKLYGILAAGRPFIAAVEDRSDIAELVQRERCGIRVEPGSSGQLHAALLWAMDHRDKLEAMGRRGRELAENLFDRRQAVEKFESLFDGLAGEQSHDPKGPDGRTEVPSAVLEKAGRTN